MGGSWWRWWFGRGGCRRFEAAGATDGNRRNETGMADWREMIYFEMLRSPRPWDDRDYGVQLRTYGTGTRGSTCRRWPTSGSRYLLEKP